MKENEKHKKMKYEIWKKTKIKYEKRRNKTRRD